MELDSQGLFLPHATVQNISRPKTKWLDSINEAFSMKMAALVLRYSLTEGQCGLSDLRTGFCTESRSYALFYAKFELEQV